MHLCVHTHIHLDIVEEVGLQRWVEFPFFWSHFLNLFPLFQPSTPNAHIANGLFLSHAIAFIKVLTKPFILMAECILALSDLKHCNCLPSVSNQLP